MINYIETREGQIGFGSTVEEANEDLYVNLCKVDLQNDIQNKFLPRRSFLKPWIPKENMLHIHTVGCLIREGNSILETRSGKSIEITGGLYSQFYILAKLFGTHITYTDILVTCRPELDTFFQGISMNCTSILDLPPIRKICSGNGFEPNVTYTFGERILLGIHNNVLGMKEAGDEMFSILDLGRDVSLRNAMAYLGYKLGYVFTESEVTQIGEQAYDI